MTLRSVRAVSSFVRSVPRSCCSCTARRVFPAVLGRHLHVLHTIAEVRQARLEMMSSSSSRPPTLGFVPTMGALHSGHIDLVKASQKHNDKTLVSIFVNPTQFLPGEDLAAYPRPLKADLALLTSNGVDYAFVPDASEMYSGVPFPPHATFVDQARIDSTEEGKVRPTHFRGVATVVTKLFNIVQPDRAYFGQKDGMQCVLIQRMVRELNMPLDIAVVPTAREEDGLAKSSRNVFLSKADRRVAPVLYRALQEGQRLWDAGEVDADAIRAAVRAVMEREGGDGLVVQYVSLASMMSGEELTGRLGERQAAHTPQTGGEIADNLPHSRVLLSVAARVGQTRLIDNVVLQRVREAPEYTNE